MSLGQQAESSLTFVESQGQRTDNDALHLFGEVHLIIKADIIAVSTATRYCPTAKPSCILLCRSMVQTTAKMPVQIKRQVTRPVIKNQLSPSTICMPQPIFGSVPVACDPIWEMSSSFSFFGSRFSQNWKVCALGLKNACRKTLAEIGGSRFIGHGA